MAQLPSLDGTNVVIVAPHPDDESLATGGLIQTALARGARVTVLVLTNGDCNPWPQRFLERRWRIGVDERARWGMRRRAEAERSLALLGVDASARRFMEWPDMGVTHHMVSNFDAAVNSLSGFFRNAFGEAAGCDVVVLPALADRHPDHSAAHVVSRLSVARAGLSPQVMSYMVHGPGDPSAVELHLNAELRRRKQAAVTEHHTQLVLSRGRMMRYAGRDERYLPDWSTAPACVASSHVLPWRIGRIATSLSHLLVIGPAGAWRLSLAHARAHSCQSDDEPNVIKRAGRLVLQVPQSLRAEGPVYAKLVTAFASPWIYDRWGWVRLDPESIT